MTEKTNRQRPRYLSLFLCLALLASMTALFSGCGTKKTDMSNYLVIKVEGYDKAGRAGYEIDYTNLGEDSGLEDALSEDMSKGGEVYYGYNFDIGIMGPEVVERYLKVCEYRFEFEEDSALENGETVTLNVSCNEETKSKLADKLKVDITCPDTITYTIGEDELPKAEVIDPFERLTVKFSGFDGEAEIKFVTDEQEESLGKYTVSGEDADDMITVKKGDKKDSCRFYIAKVNGEPYNGYDYGTTHFPSDIANGDTITVKIEEPSANAGYVFSSLQKTYKVKGLTSYLKDPDKLTSAMLTKIRKDGIQSRYNARKYDFNTVTSIVFQVKKDDDAQCENRLLIRCQDTITSGNKNDIGTHNYLNIVAENVYIKDGEVGYKNAYPTLPFAKYYYDRMPATSDPTGKKAFQELVDDDSYTSYVLK